jgi:hypothetical protein
MKTIYKYPLTGHQRQVIQLPPSSLPLSLQLQQGQPCLWVLIETDQPKLDYVVRCYGTGHEVEKMPAGFEFLGTLQSSDGTLVFHFFGYPALLEK